MLPIVVKDVAWRKLMIVSLLVAIMQGATVNGRLS